MLVHVAIWFWGRWPIINVIHSNFPIDYVSKPVNMVLIRYYTFWWIIEYLCKNENIHYSPKSDTGLFILFDIPSFKFWTELLKLIEFNFTFSDFPDSIRLHTVKVVIFSILYCRSFLFVNSRQHITVMITPEMFRVYKRESIGTWNIRSVLSFTNACA